MGFLKGSYYRHILPRDLKGLAVHMVVSTLNTQDLGPVHTYADIFENGDFFLPF